MGGLLLKGIVYVVGIGAGDYEGMTVRAVRALESAQVIVGYTGYCELIKSHFPDKDYISTPMMREIERCRLALESAASGKITAMICSGDAGVYGMASPLYEVCAGADIEIRVIPGVTAALSGAALLGAPLTSDFAVISLSDLLTPLSSIETRLRAAAESDMVVVLYNPSSKKRSDYLRRACDILLTTKPAETVCGVVRKVGREGEACQLMTLAALRDFAADMFTTVFVGNRSTMIIDGKMITPRGYSYE